MSRSITFYSLSDYNSGSLIAKTFDLEELPTYDELSEARTEWLEELTEKLDDGEIREEFIVADFEGIPSDLVGEWDIQSDFGDYLEAMDEWGEGVVEAAVELGLPLDKIGDAYAGEFSSPVDFAEEFIDSTGMLSEVPENLRYYFDVERFARDLMMDYNEHNGHYFRNNW